MWRAKTETFVQNKPILFSNPPPGTTAQHADKSKTKWMIQTKPSLEVCQPRSCGQKAVCAVTGNITKYCHRKILKNMLSIRWQYKLKFQPLTKWWAPGQGGTRQWKGREGGSQRNRNVCPLLGVWEGYATMSHVAKGEQPCGDALAGSRTLRAGYTEKTRFSWSGR